MNQSSIVDTKAWSSDRTNFDRNLAVIIGIDDYEGTKISKLSTPVSDATALADLLEKKFGYDNVRRLINADASLAGLKTLFNKTLPHELKPTESDRLIVYFAGHGVPKNSDEGPTGYLVPHNAESGKEETFLPMTDVWAALEKLQCHHLLIILDCCFAGQFRWASSRQLTVVWDEIHREHYDRFIRYPSWQVITSSAHDQEALDQVKLSQDNRGTEGETKHSPFALALLEALGDGYTDNEGKNLSADYTKDGVITSQELIVYLEERLAKLSNSRQVPGLYPLDRKYDKGQFIFVKPGFNRENLTSAPKLNPEKNPYRGLNSFEEQHANFFFGRDKLIDELRDRLVNSPNNFPLIAVLGVSGSGKSSLVKAGLVPKLRKQSDKKWYILEPMRPGLSPFSELAKVSLPIINSELLTDLNQVSFLDKKMKAILDSKSGINKDLGNGKSIRADNSEQSLDQKNIDIKQLAKKWCSATNEAKLLLILDYYEELKNFCQDSSEKQESEKLFALHQNITETLESVINKIQAKSEFLKEKIVEWIESHPETKILLVVDQFEELITLGQSDSKTNQSGSDSEQLEGQKFLEFLKVILGECSQDLRVVVTLRSDFEPRFINSPLETYWNDARFPVRAMNSDELREAITGPAEKQALNFCPDELVGQLVDEVGQMPGALPLLSFTLSELYIKLYERNKGKKAEDADRALQGEDYKALGGVAGALTRRATQEYDRLIEDKDPEDEYRGGFGKQEGKVYQATMKRVMLRMVTIEGGGVARRRVPESELVYPDPEENKRVAQVGDRLVKARLLVKGQETGEVYVEPAHDFLVRGWDKLQSWIREQQENVALKQRLTPAARDWSQGQGGLWTREVERLVWLEKILESLDNNWLNKLETEFVQQSKKQRLDELKEAEERRKLAVSRQLAAQAELARSQLIKLLPRSLLLAIESIQLSPSLEADHALRSGLNLLPRRVTKIPSETSAVAFNPNGQYIATVSVKEEVAKIQVWKADTGEKITTLSQQDDVQVLAFPPSGEYLVAVSANSNETAYIQVWEIATGNAVAKIPNLVFSRHYERNLLRSIAFSPNGEYLATISIDDDTNLVRVWEIGTAKDVFSIPQKDRVDALTFCSNGEDLYLAGTDSQNPAQIRIWEAKTSKEIIRLTGDTGYDDSITILGFSPDGKYIAASAGSILQVWDVSTSRQVTRLSEFNEMLRTVAFSPDGKHLTTLSGTRKTFEVFTNPHIVQVWEVNSGKEIARVPHDSYSERNFACSSNGKYLATGIVGGLQVWEMTRGDDKDRIASIPCSNLSSPIAFSPDGKYLAIKNCDEAKADAEGIAPANTEEIQIWEVATANKVASIPQEILGLSPEAIALSLDGKYLAAASREENTYLKVWEVATQKQVESIPQKGEVKAIAFSPNEKYLNLTVARTDNAEEVGTLQVWETATSKQLVNILNISLYTASWGGFAFNSDGAYLAIAGKNVSTERTRAVDIVRVWKVSTGQEVGCISFENFYRIDSIALSSDGQYLAMTGIEDTDEEPMYILEVSTGRPMARITSNWHLGRIALSQQYLALQVLQTVHIFLWRPEDLINEACARLNRNLTQQEWRQYFPDEPYRKTCPNLP